MLFFFREKMFSLSYTYFYLFPQLGIFPQKVKLFILTKSLSFENIMTIICFYIKF